jgi:hypothetical protein
MRRNVERPSTKKSVGVRDMFTGGRRCRAVVEPSSAGGAGRSASFGGAAAGEGGLHVFGGVGIPHWLRNCQFWLQ